MKTIFENSGGTYTQVGDYLLPNLSLTAKEKETNIGVWAMRHNRYLKQNHKVRYYNLLTSGKLNLYLVDIEEQAQNLFSRLVKDLAEKENVTEKLKSDNSMLWVQKMNNIRNRATEIVNEQVIYN
jgi:hypothetical protein